MHSLAGLEQSMGGSAAGDEQQLVVFQLGGELYGVDIARVHEIIRMQTVTRVPRAPSFVEGVINLRGKVIPVVDLRRRFGLPSAEHTRASRIVVVEIGDQVVGIVVDGVSEVLRVRSSVIEPPGPVVAGVDSEYVQGIAKLPERLVIMLDLDRVLAREERRALDAVAWVVIDDALDPQLEVERNRVVVQLAGAVAHKLKQPLAVAWGYLELLLDDPHCDLTPSTVSYLREILASLHTMDETINKLQEATTYRSRPYAGSLEILDLE